MLGESRTARGKAVAECPTDALAWNYCWSRKAKKKNIKCLFVCVCVCARARAGACNWICVDASACVALLNQHTNPHSLYKVVQIWPGRFVCKQVTVCPGHIWTTLYFHLWPLWLHHIFWHHLINGEILGGKKLLNINCVFLFSLQILSDHSKKSYARYYRKCENVFM